ncbi:hypothetical protein [Acuticoccus sediminis]|uniref:hypothetical protein n=1 Tax=Acuticoccus sediminis TaxID=2184697 RepID=UPI0011B94317|nr:hypothetical protein [Acuticoccus sediminis]
MSHMLSVQSSILVDRLSGRMRAAWGALSVPATALASRATDPIRNRYLPEKHYMRGPGPATARKSAMSAAKSDA